MAQKADRIPEPKDGYYGNFDEVSIKRGQAELNKLRAIPIRSDKPLSR